MNNHSKIPCCNSNERMWTGPAAQRSQILALPGVSPGIPATQQCAMGQMAFAAQHTSPLASRPPATAPCTCDSKCCHSASARMGSHLNQPLHQSRSEANDSAKPGRPTTHMPKYSMNSSAHHLRHPSQKSICPSPSMRDAAQPLEDTDSSSRSASPPRTRRECDLRGV